MFHFIIKMYKTFASAEFKKGPLQLSYEEQYNTILEIFKLTTRENREEKREQILSEYFFLGNSFWGKVNWDKVDGLLTQTTDTQVWNELWTNRSKLVSDEEADEWEEFFLAVYEWLYPELTEIQDLYFKEEFKEESKEKRQKKRERKQAAKEAAKEAAKKAAKEAVKAKEAAEAKERDQLIKRWETILKCTWVGPFSYDYNKKLKLDWENYGYKRKWWGIETDGKYLELLYNLPLYKLKEIDHYMAPEKTEDELEEENIEKLRKDLGMKKNQKNYSLRKDLKDAEEKFKKRKRDERIAKGLATPDEEAEAKEEAENKILTEQNKSLKKKHERSDDSDHRYEAERREDLRVFFA